MIKRLSGQEIFIISTAVTVLLFMYATIIFSAPINDLTEMNEQTELDFIIDKTIKEESSSFVYISSEIELEDKHE